jgi:hypothetical protein
MRKSINQSINQHFEYEIAMPEIKMPILKDAIGMGICRHQTPLVLTPSPIFSDHRAYKRHNWNLESGNPRAESRVLFIAER